MSLANGALKVFLALGPCDMRKSFNGFHTLATEQLRLTSARDALFAFINKRRSRVKLLDFDGTGTWVAAKRLEKGRFNWPVPSEPGQRRIRLHAEALHIPGGGLRLQLGRNRAENTTSGWEFTPSPEVPHGWRGRECVLRKLVGLWGPW
nr:IS66 family insertion sequence element accessory protein TnpB [Haloferula luteola]